MRIEQKTIHEANLWIAWLNPPSDKTQSLLDYQRECVNKLLEHAGYSPSVLRHTKEGQPYIDLQDAAFLSITHTKHCVAIALSPNPIGIDIEALSPRVQRIMPRVLGKDEFPFLPQTLSEADATRIWCTKEAVFKLYGSKAETITQIKVNAFSQDAATTAPPFAARVIFLDFAQTILAVATQTDN